MEREMKERKKKKLQMELLLRRRDWQHTLFCFLILYVNALKKKKHIYMKHAVQRQINMKRIQQANVYATIYGGRSNEASAVATSDCMHAS